MLFCAAWVRSGQSDYQELSNAQQTVWHKKKTAPYDVVDPGYCLRQAHICGDLKPVNVIWFSLQ